MQYTVVHSNDPYLLARLATDLQMEGVEELTAFDSNPFNPDEKWMAIHNTHFYTMCHEGLGDITRHELTSSNYIKVLTQILS